MIPVRAYFRLFTGYLRPHRPKAVLLSVIFLVGGQTLLERVLQLSTMVSVVIELAEGGTLTGETVVAEGYELVTPPTATCRIEPNETLELMWRSADGAWAYVA